MYNRTQTDLDKQHRKKRKMIKSSLVSFQKVADMILDPSIEDVLLRETIFTQITKSELSNRRDQLESWLNDKYKDVFTLLVHTRYSYLRQFAPTLLEHLSIEKEDAQDNTLIQAIDLIRDMNQSGKRQLDSSAPVNFMPKSTQNLVVKSEGQIDKPAWECALLTAVKTILNREILLSKTANVMVILTIFLCQSQSGKPNVSVFFKGPGFPVTHWRSRHI